MDENTLYDLVSEGVDETPVNGYALLQSWGKHPTKNGGTYIAGKFSTGKGVIDFKAWSNSNAYESVQSDNSDIMIGSVVMVTGNVNIYNGQRSIVAHSISSLDTDKLAQFGLSAEDFLFSKYDLDAYWVKFNNLLKKNLSEKALKVFDLVMEKYGDSFKAGYGAVFYHDACKGGLLAHSLKVCQMATVVSLYPTILKRVSKDVLYLGCALHDLGKLLEYSNGAISDQGRRLCHTVMTPLMLAEFKDEIIENMGELSYYDLISIAANHHGEAGEPPRTVSAYVVHMLDLLESRFQSLEEQLDGADSGVSIQSDGFKLF